MMIKWKGIAIWMMTMMLITGCGSKETEQTVQKPQLQVFIAASLKEAMEDIASDYQEIENVEIIYNSGSSGKLQTQIEAGADCDLFFSAGKKQVDALVDGDFVNSEDVYMMLQNQVQLIKPSDMETEVTGFLDITKAQNIALAGEGVPVGQYARQIFEHLGITDEMMAKEINECEDVSAVLAAVSQGSNEIGIVYATDAALAGDKIEILDTADETWMENKVLYPLAKLNHLEADDARTQAVDDFVNYLNSEAATKVFEAYGFTIYQ